MEDKISKMAKNKATLFLERNKIWFTTILASIVSVAVALAGIVSCYADIKQAKLTELEIQNKNRENQPFFSIEQEYDQERRQYIYTVCNTGGEVRYSNLDIMPVLFITQYAEDGTVKKRESIGLSGLYQYELIDENQGGKLIAFSDKWVDSTLVQDKLFGLNGSASILLNDFFMHLCSKNNSEDKAEYTTGELAYCINVSYYNFQNEEMYEKIWYGRSSDLSKRTEGNNVLFIQPSLEDWYHDDMTKEKFSVDSMNLTLEETLDECEDYIDKLLVEWN